MSKALELQKYLRANDADFDEVYENTDGTIEISITWGDWKHSHAYLRYLMTQKGYIETDCEVTEDDGSDCYSATHWFKHINS